MRPRIVIRADASDRIGGGHVMRCLSLANALAERGAEVCFVSALLPDRMREAIRGSGHDVQRIEAGAELTSEGPGWDGDTLSTPAQRADAENTIDAAGAADWFVIDHYRLDARWSSCVPIGSRRLVIDDLANRPHACELLVDQTFGRTAADYAGMVSDTAKVLAGARYAMLQGSFAAERRRALVRREQVGEPRTLLVSLGATDVGGVTAGALESVLSTSIDLAIDVVIGNAPSRARVDALAAAHPQIRVHVDTDRMVELITRADVAIGAAGTSAWERCCLGLPAVTLVLADNQRLVASNLESAGAILVASAPAQVGPALTRLCTDEGLRMRMIAAAAAITDGRGAAAVAEAMLTPATSQRPALTIRPATAEDGRAAWLWRNDPVTRAVSQIHDPVPWPDHADWWSRALASPDRRLFVAEAQGEPLAVIRFDRLDEPAGSFEVSINVKPEARGGGVGRSALAAACEHFLKSEGAVPLVAVIHRENRASQRVFARIGFTRERRVGEAGFERYLRPGGASRAS